MNLRISDCIQFIFCRLELPFQQTVLKQSLGSISAAAALQLYELKIV